MSTQNSYLDEVRRRLDGLTDSQRATVLDDLRGHLADAADAGRTDDEAIAALGSPAEIATRVYEEFGGAPVAVERARRVLLWTAVGAGVVLAVIVAFLLPTSGGWLLPETLADAMGFTAVLVCLIPAVIALVPLRVPERARPAATLGAAIVLTVSSLIAAFSVGGFLTPVAMLAWAAVITPWRLRVAGGFTLPWRLAGAAIVALPALVLVAAFLTGTVGLGALAVILIVVTLVLAVLIAVGHRFAGWSVAVLGGALMLTVLLNAGLLALAVIWAGGLLLAVGLSHALGARRG